METTANETPTGTPDGKWAAETRVESFMQPHPEDQRTPTYDRPLVMPVRWWSQVVGVKANEVSAALLSERQTISERQTTPKDYGYASHEQNWRLVSDKPFVVVHARDGDKYLRHQMSSARQMHKGELGRRPPLVRKPQVLPSEIPDPDNGHWTKDYENYVQPDLNWVELNELAEIIGLKAEEIIAGFASFSPSTFYEPNVPILASFHGDLRRSGIIRAYVGKPPKTFCEGERYWGGESVFDSSQLPSFMSRVSRENGKVLVPQSFAYAVIRLVQFGYRTDNETLENSFRLEAPMPTPPEPKMPVLSVGELRELHPLKSELPEEHTEWMFRLLAENALRTRSWQDSKVMGDTSEGFSYYTNFRRLDLDTEDGCITIAACHWTRAGAGKTPNYYAGLLAVFPKRVDDPRRDESAILRIWFLPDRLQRLLPTGSKGGLCPSEVPAGLAERVKRFVGGLGYAV